MAKKYTKKELEQQIIGKLRRNFGREVEEATPVHMFRACALVLRDIMSARELETESRIRDSPPGPLPLPGVSHGPLPGEERL